jgi:non-specific serine/threonine protein kinase
VGLCSQCGGNHSDPDCPALQRTAALPAAKPGAAEAIPEISLRPGTSLGEYVVLEQIGQGAMGTVFAAIHPVIEKKVAIKVLSNLVSYDADTRKRFVLEARAANQIGHPNIVDVFAFGELPDGRLFYVMELLSGSSLEDHLKQHERLDEDEALWIVIQLSDALAAAHELGIIHRDLKPDNVFLDGVGKHRRVKLLDFGIAKLVEQGREVLPIAGGVPIGTPAYMSPEQCRGSEVDARSDIYSLGAILFEVLIGRLPFEGSTVSEIMKRHIEEAPPAPRSLRPISAQAEQLILRCLEKDPAKRVQSAAELREIAAEIRRNLAPPAPQRPAEAPGPARATAWRRRSNLPRPQTSLVGREAVVQNIVARFATRGVRLLTLTGPGGVGKTRVGISAAAALEGRFADGVHFVRLAAVRDPSAVASAIAHTLEIREQPGRTLLESIGEQVGSAAALLVLDNFEQIVAAAGVVEELLQACPNLVILVTSRFALRVPGEHECVIPPLELPARASLEAIATNAAVQLFIDRVRAFHADFALNAQNSATIATICRRLDGLPLAIELAAARVRVLSLDALLARLDDRLSVLTGGSSSLDPRHQALRATIAWSYELLSEPERVLMRRLAVFVGGFTLDSANSVTGHGELPADLLDLLSQLVEKSLIARRVLAGGEPRFFMLETIREFAREELVAKGELAATRMRHAAHFGAFAAMAETSFERLDVEHDNIRAALDWEVRGGSARSALRLAAALWPFWERRGFLAQGRKHLEDVLAISTTDSTDVLRDWLRVLHGAAVLCDAQGDYAPATRFFDKILAVHRARGEPRGVATSLNNMAVSAERKGDLARARDLYGQSMRIFRDLGADSAVIWSLYNLAQVSLHLDDFEGAAGYCTEGIAIAERLGDRKAATWLSVKLANVRLAQGQSQEAYELCAVALGNLEDLGDAWSVATALGDFGRICHACGNTEEAKAALSQSLSIRAALGDQTGVAAALEALARLAMAASQFERVLLLAGAASAIRQLTGAALASFEGAELQKEIERARAQLDENAARVAWEKGMETSVEDLMALVVP